jgi:Kef-type K+ transport system membrane component KefB
MLSAILSISGKDYTKLWLIGRFFGKRTGKNIGEFFKELIDKLAGGRNGVEKAKAASKVAISVAALVGTLSLCLIALVILWKTNDLKDLAGGVGLLLGVVGFALGIIWLLGSKWFKREANEGLKGIKDILLLIGGLTLSLALLVYVARKTKWTDMVQGIIMLSAVMAFTFSVIMILGNQKFEKEALDGL